MVSFEKSKGRFNYRVAGVAIHNERVLLDRNMRNNYWVLPGGHPDMMEDMSTALSREMFEEIGADVEVIRLLWIMENFFYKDKPIHELSFYFLMQITGNSPLLQSDGPFFGEEHGYQLTYQWYPLEETILTNLPLYPAYLASGLIDLPASPQHIVFDDAHQSRMPKHRARTTSSVKTTHPPGPSIHATVLPGGEPERSKLNKG